MHVFGLILCWEGLEEDSLQWHWRESYIKQDKESDQGNWERYTQTNALELIHTCKPLETLFLRSISVSPKKEMLTEILWSNMYILLQCARISYWRATLFVIITIMNQSFMYILYLINCASFLQALAKPGLSRKVAMKK